MKWVKGVKRYKYKISPGGVMYSIVTTINNTLLHNRKFLKEILKVLITERKTLNVSGDEG